MVLRREVLLKLQIAPNKAERSFDATGIAAVGGIGGALPFAIGGGGGGGGGDGTLEPNTNYPLNYGL